MSQTATRTNRLQAAHEKLQDAVGSIVSGEDWQRMLRTASKFHHYSFNNQLLIFLQRPDATHVAGFHRWKSLGRTVKKGEKGIAIFAPCKYKSAPPSDNPSGSSSGGKGKSESGPSGSDLAVKVRERSKSTEDGFHLRGFRVVHVFDTLSRDLARAAWESVR